MTTIHPTAIVDTSAELGEGVEIGPYAIVEAGARIGSRTTVGSHSVIGAGTVLGEGNRIFSSAQVGVAPQDLKHLSDAVGRTVIGSHNVIREFVTISSSTVYPGDTGEKATVIGDRCMFMASTHVAHDCTVGSGVIMANCAGLAGHVTVQDGVIIGGLVGIHQFCVLGRLSFIGGLARVNKDVPPYMIVEGHPARCHGPNAVGLARNGLDPAAIARIRKMYRLLYRSGLNTTQALERIEAETEDCPERDVLVRFVRESPRGICK